MGSGQRRLDKAVRNIRVVAIPTKKIGDTQLYEIKKMK